MQLQSLAAGDIMTPTNTTEPLNHRSHQRRLDYNHIDSKRATSAQRAVDISSVVILSFVIDTMRYNDGDAAAIFSITGVT